MPSADSFIKQLKGASKGLKQAVTDGIRKVAIDGFTRLVEESPVDTGRFKGNWNFEVNGSKGAVDKDNKDKVGKKTVAKGAKASKGFDMGDTISLYNNVEYGIFLEYGHSGQAPKGWVRSVAQDMESKIKEINTKAKDGTLLKK